MVDVPGLLDDAYSGWENWWHPKTVPTGATYDPETLGSARAAAIGNLGGNLLALAQGGLSPETRAQLMMGIGKTPLTYQQSMLAGTEGRLHAAQAAAAEQEVAGGKAFASQIDAELARRTAGGGTPGATGAAGATGGARTATGPAVGGDVGSYSRAALAALKGPESGGRANLQNEYGYSGLYQIGTGLASSAGLYEPAKDEAVSDAKGHAVNAWRGTWNIPGFQPMSHQQFLQNPDAQQAAAEKAMEHNWADIQRQGLDKYVGQTIGNVTITPQALLQGAWLGGVGGLKSWLSGTGDPQDANKTPVSRWASLQAPGGTATDAGRAQAVPGGGGGSGASGGPGGGVSGGGAGGVSLDATDAPRRRGDLSALTPQQLALMKTMPYKEARQYLLQQSSKVEPTRLTPAAVKAYDLDPGASWVWDENGVPKKLQDAPARDLTVAEKAGLGYASDAVVQRDKDNVIHLISPGKSKILSVPEKVQLGYGSDAVIEQDPTGKVTVHRAGLAHLADAKELAAGHYDPTAIVEIKPDGSHVVHSKGGTRTLSPAEIEGRYPPGTVVKLGPDGEQVVQQSQLLDQQRQAETLRHNVFADTAGVRKEIESGQIYTKWSAAVPQLHILRQAATVGNGAADMAMIYAYATMLDPGSVVREGDSTMVQRTGGVWDTVQGMISSVKGQGHLSPEVRAQLVDMAESVFHSYEKPMAARVDAFRSLAKRQGLDPDNVYPEFQHQSTYTAPGEPKRLPANHTKESFTNGLKASVKANPVARNAARQLMIDHGLNPDDLDKP